MLFGSWGKFVILICGEIRERWKRALQFKMHLPCLLLFYQQFCEIIFFIGILILTSGTKNKCFKITHINRERFRLKILHSKSAKPKINLHSNIIFCLAICEFCISNLKCLKLQYAVCTVQVLFFIWFIICIQKCDHILCQNYSKPHHHIIKFF